MAVVSANRKARGILFGGMVLLNGILMAGCTKTEPPASKAPPSAPAKPAAPGTTAAPTAAPVPPGMFKDDDNK